MGIIAAQHYIVSAVLCEYEQRTAQLMAATDENQVMQGTANSTSEC